MDKNNTLFNPVKMLKGEREVSREFDFRIYSFRKKYTASFQGLAKMKDYQIKFYTSETVKPIAVPPQLIPPHLKARIENAIESMIKEVVNEEHPPNEPSPSVSCAVIMLKSVGFLGNYPGCF